ncbi:MAG: CehA/McbA family metallohydrolase [Acidobacteriota bacterium]
MARPLKPWLLLLAAIAGAVQAPVAESPGRLWVRIQDEQGRPVAARIYLSHSQGAPLIPSGSIARQSRTGEYYFHAGGAFQLEAPPGRVTVEAVKGFEYVPAKTQTVVVSDRTTAAALTLRRLANMPSSGWHSGDVHMHANHVPGALYMTMDDCLVLAKGEDIHVSNLLAGSVGVLAHVFDTEFFNDGKPDPLSTPDHLLVVQQEVRNVSAMYGHIALLGISRFVEPFFIGQSRSANWEDYPALYAPAMAAKAQGAVVTYLHPANKPEIPVGDHLAREFPVDLALGAADALDILSNMDEEAGCWMYYRVLNCGLKCTASAGTDSQMDQRRSALSGASKVYVKTSAPLSYAGWLAGYKAGRTFVSNGPLLWLEVEGKEPGAEIQLAAPRTLRAVAKARSVVPMSTIELVANGEVVASAAATENGTVAEIARELPLNRSSWVAARVWGPANRLVMNDARAFAHSSPVYCYIGKQKIAFPEDAKTVIAWIDRVVQDLETSPRFASEARRNEVIALFKKGRAYYEGIVRQ